MKNPNLEPIASWVLTAHQLLNSFVVHMEYRRHKNGKY